MGLTLCGIFGTASSKALIDERPLLEALTDRLQHRGPDGRGSYLDSHAFLGHRRLAVIDLEGGHQPMHSFCGQFVISYNGEVYNFKEVRDELIRLGYAFLTQSDTEVVLRAFTVWGIDCVRKFNGIFAFAVWDTQERQLWLVRDRLGVKPLYYTFLGDQILFSSEMKSLTAHPRFLRQANLKAISSYLSFRTTVGSETVFTGIRRLQPGCYLHYHDAQHQLHRYWDVPCPDKRPDLGEDFYLDQVGRLLRNAVKRQMVSDVPVGAYLSGGVDSSLLVALMKDVSDGPLKTYSIGFDMEGYDEGAFARTASNHIGTRHRHIILGPEAYADGLEALVRHRDEPLSIPHEVALHALSQDIKQDVTVCLSGEGADELFGGYGRTQSSPFDFARLSLFHRLPMPAKRVLQAMVKDPDIRARLAITDELEHFFHLYHWWSFTEKTQLLTEEAQAAIEGDRDLKQEFQDIFTRLKGCTGYDRVFYVFEKIHLVNLLERLDMQSMACSVEARVPFADHELVEFVSVIPVRHKIRWNSAASMLRACFYKTASSSERFDTTKYLLRRLADEKLPPAIARRKKLGFPVPLDIWFRRSLYDFASDVLLDTRTRQRGIFRIERVAELLDVSRQSEYDRHGKQIWMLLNVELWFRNNIDVGWSFGT
ncbi:asparagine synthase (glutamine-hydrolyzing) [Rhizobium ruizarguesonis]|uniref:asparagine synthase (glutamine-hydrolyzing) n=1 Tax=Rhizobium ruizarguesonis TaxID=2081791 RepID=UPI0037147C36